MTAPTKDPKRSASGRSGHTPEVLIWRLAKQADSLRLAQPYRDVLRALADGAGLADLASKPETLAVLLGPKKPR